MFNLSVFFYCCSLAWGLLGHEFMFQAKLVSESPSWCIRGGSQSTLYGVGLLDEDMGKHQVDISSVWYEGNTYDMFFLKLGEAVKEGVMNAGLVGLRFNTMGVSDAISMGTKGMCYSLQSRDLIVDSIETVKGASATTEEAIHSE